MSGTHWTPTEEAVFQRLVAGEASDVEDLVKRFAEETGRPFSRASIDSRMRRDGIKARDVICAHARKVDAPQPAVKVPAVDELTAEAQRLGMYPSPPVDWTGSRPASTGTGLERRVLLGDLHIPFHDLRACATALAIIRAVQPHRVIQMGDLWNMGAVDHHPRPFGGKENHNRAMLMGRGFLEAVKRAAPGAELVVLLGNHDSYAEEYEDANAHHAGLFVPDWLSSIATVIPRRRQPWICGPVAYLHGYGGGEHAAKKYALEIAPACGVKNVKAAHHHNVQRFHAKNGCEGWIVGWLGDERQPTFDYAKMRGHWERAVVLEDVIGDRVTTTPVRLDGGAALVYGRLVQAA